jgi:hypothetical protein
MAEDNKKFLVVWSIQTIIESSFPDSESLITDHWEAFDDNEDAQARYKEVLELDDLFVASIALVTQSTDY